MQGGDGRFDDVFLGLAQQHGGIQPLLNSFFGFLHRRTDFYVQFPEGTRASMGFPPGAAEKMVLDAFRAYPMKPYPASAPAPAPVSAPARDKTKPESKAAARSTPAAKPKPVQEEQKTVEAEHPQAAQTKPDANNSTESDDTQALAGVRYTEEGKQYPIGNGGLTSNYSWTQTLKDVTVFIDVDRSVTARDVRCNISSRRLTVQAAPGTPHALLIDGPLYEAVRTDESMWTLESDDGRFNTIVITLDKVKPTWWSCVVQGDEEIDTTKVDSTQKLEEYDAETQAAIRKIMFEQRQKMMGLPAEPNENSVEAILERAKNAPGSPFLPAEQRIAQTSDSK